MTNDPLNPLLIDEKKVAQIIGVSQAKLRELYASGELGPIAVLLGHCKRWRRDDVVKWIELLCPPRKQFLELTGETEPSTALRSLPLKRRVTRKQRQAALQEKKGLFSETNESVRGNDASVQ